MPCLIFPAAEEFLNRNCNNKYVSVVEFRKWFTKFMVSITLLNSLAVINWFLSLKTLLALEHTLTKRISCEIYSPKEGDIADAKHKIVNVKSITRGRRQSKTLSTIDERG